MLRKANVTGYKFQRSGIVKNNKGEMSHGSS